MFPILVFVYTRLARAEEREVAARFGDAWRDYAATPAFLPRRRRHGAPSARRGGHTPPAPIVAGGRIR